MVKPALATGAECEPGLISRNMSLSPVFGRSSAAASVWMSGLYSGSMSIETIAWPSCSLTPPISPTLTPETRTVWPWPGVTACAVDSAALRCSGASSHGNRKRSLVRM
jgi:hypothetical protein